MNITKVDKIVNNFMVKIIEIYNLDFFKQDYLIDQTKEKEAINILKNYIKNVDFSELKKIIKNKNYFEVILCHLEIYGMIHLSLTYGILYDKFDTYFNNSIYFKKDIELKGFISKHYILIKEILILLKDNSKENIMKYTNGNKFINAFSDEVKNKLFFNKNGELKIFSIVSTIIIHSQYLANDKQEFNRMIDKMELENKDFIFIDILCHEVGNIEYQTFYDILKDKHISQLYWLFSEDINNFKYSPLTIKNKINNLIDCDIIYPVIDDILLYHNENEKYTSTNKNTKLSYILTKINRAQNLYADENVYKIFYHPLFDSHRALTVNNKEDIKIINKFLQVINKNNDKKYSTNILTLQELRNYPYVSYNHISKDTYGFYFYYSDYFKTKTAYRHVGIKNKKLLTRQLLPKTRNIITGFVLKTSDSIDNDENIRFVTRETILDLIDDYISGQKLEYIYCWIFNKDDDKLNFDKFNYDFTDNEIELIISLFYNEIIKIVEQNFVHYLMNNTPSSLNEVLEYKKKLLSKLNIELTDKIKENMEHQVHKFKNNQKFTEITQKKKFDKLLVVHKKDNLKYQKIIINDKQNKELIAEKNEQNIELNQICQHILMWDKITEINRKSSKFIVSIQEFTENFVNEINKNEFICKSCGTFLDLHKYVSDGIYDRFNEEYITYSTYIHFPLEEIYEYKQYESIISHSDLLLQQIGLICGISYLTGKNKSNKLKRKNIIKILIDIIVQHNKNLNNKLNFENYGITSSTNLFIFELNNNIFTISDKNIDSYRHIKKNNIISYLIFLIILDLNNFDTIYLTNKGKYCNIDAFEKLHNNIFSKFKFDNDLYAINYKIFCYLLYIISCLISSAKLWEDKSIDIKDKQKNQKIQNQIINTVIHIIVSILKTNSTENIYKLIKSKFYDKLDSLYNDKKLYESLLKKDIEIESIYYEKKIIDNAYWENSYFKMYLNTIKIKDDKNNFKNFYTNCINGNFHDWIISYKSLKCYKCQILSNINADNEEEINNNYYNILLNDISKKYCIHILQQHDFVNNICINCKKSIDYNYTENDFRKLEENILKIRKNKQIYNIINNRIKINYDDNIDNFITLLKEILKNEDNLFLNYRDTKYEINHNHKEMLLETPYILDDINVEYNDDFKGKVYYYIKNNIIIFYSYITLNYIGYKELNKDYVRILSKNYMTIKYSLYDKIKYLGCQYFHNNNDPNRLSNLKNIVFKFQKIFYNIIYNKIEDDIFIDDNEEDEENEEDEKNKEKEEENNNNFYNIIKNIIRKYILKFENIDINYEIFDDWYNKYTEDSEIFLYYILDEFTKLLKHNSSEYVQNLISKLIIDFIDIIFRLYNIENSEKNILIKRFEYMLNSCIDISDIENYEFQKKDETDEIINDDEDDMEYILDQGYSMIDENNEDFLDED